MPQELATTNKKDLKELIVSDQTREQLMMALPRYYSPEQFTVIVRTALNKNPRLAGCTPESFMVAMMTAAQMGIAPDGRQGHLVPRWNKKLERDEATFQPDYKGLVSLVRRNNDNVADVYAELVCENDHIQLTKGLKRDLIHEVDVKKARGAFIGVYAVILYKDGTTSMEYLNRGDIEKIRAHSDSWKKHEKDGWDTPWISDEGEMWKKSAINRLMKLADLSEDTSDRLYKDQDFDGLRLASAVEIKKAALPPHEEESEANRLVDEAMKEDQQAVKRAQQEEQSQKRPVGRPRKLTPTEKPVLEKPAETKPVEAEKPTHPETMAEKTERMVKEAGFTTADFMRVAKENEWLDKNLDPATTPIETLGDENLENFIDPENWPTVLTELRAGK